MNRLKVIAVLVGAVIVLVGGYFAWRQWGAWAPVGVVLTPIAVVTAGAAAILKSGGAKPIPKNDTGRPRRPGPSAVSPTPAAGKTRARPRRNRGRF